MEKNKQIVIGVIVLAVALLVWQFYSPDMRSEQNSRQENEEVTKDGLSGFNSGTIGAEIVFKDGVYTPSSVTINKGETVVFKNESDKTFWPASDIHPTHTEYPGSSIGKCADPEEDDLFDACEPLVTGSKLGFSFYEVGTWSYHDHLRPSARGTITVK